MSQIALRPVASPLEVAAPTENRFDPGNSTALHSFAESIASVSRQTQDIEIGRAHV